MKVLVTSVFLIAVTFAGSALAQVGDADAGQAKVATCTACHGTTGAGIAPLYPNLGGQGEKYLLKQMQDIQSGLRPVVEMTGFLDNATPQDLADMAAYYASQPKNITGAQLLADEAYNLSEAEFLALGEAIYRGGNPDTSVPACTGCHSPSGQGNFPAGYPMLSGQYADYVIKQLVSFQNNLRVNDGDTRIMRGVAEHMSDLEIRAVANFIAGLN